MSFEVDINNVLQNNTALNTALNNRIYSFNLPDAADISLSYLVFNYKKEDGIHTLQAKNILQNYVLYIVIISQNTVTNAEISALVLNYFDDYQDENFLDVTYNDDNNGQDQESERYFKTLEFKIIYKQ